MRVGIVGCGLIGRRRAEVIRGSAEDELVLVADVDFARARALAAELGGCEATADTATVVGRDDLDAVVVSTPNKYLVPIGVAALQRGRHVLVEKPPGRNRDETRELVEAARRGGRTLKVGFNHRHHPAIARAHAVCRSGGIGALTFIRAVYGHGGRPGYADEWRGDPDLSGGGELLDQGVHVLDLCRWFMGDFAQAYGQAPTFYWGTAGSVEDNAFALLQTPDGRVAQLHTSWTQWKNRFSFEVFGLDGYVRVEGLGGSYGVETLTIGRRRPESGPPDEERTEYPGPDTSWQDEWREFAAAIREGRPPMASGEEGLAVMDLIAAVYESARTGAAVGVRPQEGGGHA